MVNYISKHIKKEMNLEIKLDMKASSKMINFMEMEFNMLNFKIRTDKNKLMKNTLKYIREIG